MKKLWLFLAAGTSLLGQAPSLTTTTLLPEGITGRAYDLTFTATNNPTSWSAIGTPAWATFNPATGTLTGTPDSPGTTILTVTASNGGGSSVPTPFTLIVLPEPICRNIGDHRWLCGNSGNSRLNGRELMAMSYNGPVWECGDTIILTAGARYSNIYNTNGRDHVRAFRLQSQAGCAPGRQTRIVSSQLEAIPHDLNPRWATISPAQKSAYVSQMAQLVGEPPSVGVDSGEHTTVNLSSTAANYYLGGIAIVTPLGSQAGSMGYTALGTSTSAGPKLPAGSYAQNIEIDRCFLGDPEDYVYGSVEDWYNPAYGNQADVNTWNTWYRAGNIGVYAEGDNWYIHDSVIITTGFDPYEARNPSFSCTGGTNGRPAILTCPGVAAALGISSSPACDYLAPVYGCNQFSPIAAEFAIFTGAGSGWAGPGKLNGIKYLVYVDADHVAVYEAWRELPLTNPTPIDSTSWGAFSGTVRAKAVQGTQQSVQYGIVSEAGNYNHRYENNFISDQGGSSNIFLGGGTVQADNHAAVLAGSSCSNPYTAPDTCILKLSRTDNLNPGDWVWLSAVRSPARSVCCPSGFASNIYCAAGIDRVGIVTAVNGNDVTLTGANAGFSCVDPGAVLDIANLSSTALPIATGTVTLEVQPGLSYANNQQIHIFSQSDVNNWMDGVVTGYAGTSLTVWIMAVNGSGTHSDWIVSPYAAMARWNGRVDRYYKVSGNTLQRQHFGYGKAYVEVKGCQQCLFTGNRMCCSGGSDIFVEAHMQGNNPWVNGSLFEYSYNLLGSRDASPLGFFEMGQDPESSNVPSWGMRLLHNISVDIPFLPGYENQIFMPTSGSPNVRYAHNTFLAQSGANPYSLISGSDACTLNGVSLGTYMQSPGASIDSNILGFGGGTSGTIGVCDPFPWGIHHNLFLNDLGFPSLPGWVAAQNNTTVNTRSAIGFTGSCTTDSYLDCRLSNASLYKGSAPDGADPGADVYAMQDRLNRWSEQAGILMWDPNTATLVNHAAAFTIGANQVALQFRVYSPIAGCSVKLFTDPARTVLAADTATTGDQACSRPGNLGSDIVTLVLGTVHPLMPATMYAYQITDGQRTMVGTFTTALSNIAGPVAIQLSDTSATDMRIEYSASPAFSSPAYSAPAAFENGIATASAMLPPGISYYRWEKRIAGVPVGHGPAQLAFR